jgi:hypothetical protein
MNASNMEQEKSTLQMVISTKATMSMENHKAMGNTTGLTEQSSKVLHCHSL